jgi:hypothetical protein
VDIPGHGESMFSDKTIRRKICLRLQDSRVCKTTMSETATVSEPQI